MAASSFLSKVGLTPKAHFFEDKIDSLKCCILLEDLPTDHLVTSCHLGIERVQVIHEMGIRFVSSKKRPKWMHRDGSINLKKLRKEVDMSDAVAEKLLTSEKFVKVSNLHFAGRQALNNWSRVARSESRNNPCSICHSEVTGRIERVAMSPEIAMVLKTGKLSNPESCPNLLQETRVEVIDLDQYAVLNAPPIAFLRQLEMGGRSFFRAIPTIETLEDVRSLSESNTRSLLLEFEQDRSRWNQLSLKMQIAFNQKLDGIGIPVIPFTIHSFDEQLSPEELEFFKMHFHEKVTPQIVRVLFNHDVDPNKGQRASMEYSEEALLGIDLHGADVDGLSRAQLRWCQLALNQRASQLPFSKIHLFALRLIREGWLLSCPLLFESLSYRELTPEYQERGFTYLREYYSEHPDRLNALPQKEQNYVRGILQPARRFSEVAKVEERRLNSGENIPSWKKVPLMIYLCLAAGTCMLVVYIYSALQQHHGNEDLIELT